MKKYLIYITIIFAVLINSHNLFAIEAVTMTCTQVNPDGSVIIYWDNPGDMDNFKQYKIYHSSDGLVFTQILPNIETETETYIHNTNQGNLRQQFYYVDIIDLSDDSSISDTIGTVFLQLDNNEPDFNKADLYFSFVSDPPPQNTIGNYQIYWDYPDGSWNLIGSSDNGIFTTEVIVCYDSINFKVELENQNGCSSVSNIAGNLFKDIEYPEQTVFDSVSINDNSYAVLGWQPTVSDDVVGYILYQLQTGIWVAFDTIIEQNKTFYIDIRYSACNETRKYAIAAIDSCGNKSEGSFLKPIRPILLYDIGFNVCAQQDTLVWEQYINAEPEIDNYIIWRSDDGVDFSTVGTIPPPPDETTKMQFIDEGIDPGINYEYFVQAVFGNNTSSSCKKTVESFSYKMPQHLYFANADVLPNNEIELIVDVDTSVFSCTWELHRYDPINAIDNAFSSATKSELSNFPLNIFDDNVEPQNTFYEYYALVYDSCGIQRLGSSNTLKTIHLTGNKPDEPTNRIEWTAFDGWETEVEEYSIYRLSGNENNFILIDSVSGETLTYDDIIAPEQAADGKFSYFVEAKQTAGGIYDYQAYSRSNIFDLFFDSEVFFPNAFRPTSEETKNQTFKPLFTYFSGSDYLLQIYNRWGQLIFETSNPEEGWNGTADGKTLSSGLFVYRLTYKNIHGIGIEKKGTVMLVK